MPVRRRGDFKIPRKIVWMSDVVALGDVWVQTDIVPPFRAASRR